MYNNSSGTPVNIYNPTFERNQIISTNCNCNKVAFNSEEAKKTRRGLKNEAEGTCFVREIIIRSTMQKEKIITGSPIHRGWRPITDTGN